MGNPNAKGTIGNKGGGRKGYSFEEEHLKDMREILSTVLELIKKIADNKATKEDYEKLKALERVVMKILDKLHATKSEMDMKVLVRPLTSLLNDSDKREGDTTDT